MKDLALHIRRVFTSIDPWFIAAMAIGAGLRFSRLGDYDNQYYTATVASMLQNWHNFVFVSFDPLGFVMVDKPPAAFWLQAIPAALFGISAWSVSLPQAIIGTIAIGLMYIAIKPVFGRTASIATAMTLAVVPASVIIDSRNEPDSLVSLSLVCAALSLILSIKTGRWRWLLLFAIMTGIAFNAKMFVGFVALPAFFLYYLIATKQKNSETALRIVTTITIILVVSLSWVIFVDLTSKEKRPYIGSTSDNSIWTLIIEYNGLRRFTSFAGPPRNANPQVGVSAYQPNNPMMRDASQGRYTPQPRQPALPGQPPPPQNSTEKPGLLSLFKAPMSDQLGWALPFAMLMGGVTLINLLGGLGKSVYQRPTSIFTYLKNSDTASQSLLWIGWFSTSLVIFGMASATMTHPYYLVGVAAPMAAVIGIGFSQIISGFSKNRVSAWVATGLVLIGIVFEIYGAWPKVSELSITLVVIIISFGSLVIINGIRKGFNDQPLTKISFLMLAASMLVIPLTASLSAGGRIVGNAQNIRPYIMYPPRQVPLSVEPINQTSRILNFIHSKQPHKTLTQLATINAREAAPYIIAGVPTIAIGGFSGRDPILTVDSFTRLTQDKKINYFLMQRQSSGRGPALRANQEPILDLIKSKWQDVSRKAKLPDGTLYENTLLS